MKRLIFLTVIALLFASCDPGGYNYPDPKSKTLNKDYVKGFVMGNPISYDDRLGYEVPMDINKNGVFDPGVDQYVWIANELYDNFNYLDSLQISAVHFYQGGFKTIDEYIVVKVISKSKHLNW